MKNIFKNIKKFYQEHRIFTILISVVIVCLVLIVTVLIQCFYVGNGTDKYGNRLENISKYEIPESKQDDFEHNIANNEKVEKVDLTITGRIVYIKIALKANADLVTAKNIAEKSLENFSEEEKSYYDFHFVLKQSANEKSEGFTIEGAKNKNSKNITWNNNRVVEEKTA